MNLFRHSGRAGSSLFLLAVALPVLAQIATVDVSSPTDPYVSYDEDPYQYSPPISENPTVIYPGGAGTGSTAYTTDPVTSQQPAVVTSGGGPPDTYTVNRSPWNFHYAPPVQPPGPSTAVALPARFDFGTATSPLQSGYLRVSSQTLYSQGLGYGWANSSVSDRDRGEVGTPGGGERALERDFCLPGAGNAFYVDLPDGKYRVDLVVGDSALKSGISLRADGMPHVPGIGAAAGSWARASFFFQVGRDAYSSTRIDANNRPLPQQRSGRARFEFLASVAHINALTITPATDEEWNKPTIFIASDSTVSNYGQPAGDPDAGSLMGWGQALPLYFTDAVRIDNMAQAGRSSRSFAEEGLLDVVLNRIKPGDYFFIMFAINDSADTLPGTYNARNTKPESTHKAWTRLYINETRKRGGIPVLVTSQIKCTYDQWGRFMNSVQGYPQADRELGADMGVTVLDLNKLSIDYLTALGPAKDPNGVANGDHDGDPATNAVPEGHRWHLTRADGSFDYIHLQKHGAVRYAELVARLIKRSGLAIAEHLKLTESVGVVSAK
jgi:lysophospholipase L1-like esterase